MTRRVRRGFAQHARDGQPGAKRGFGHDAARHEETVFVQHHLEKLLQVRVLRAAACCRTLALSPYLPSARLRAEVAKKKNVSPTPTKVVVVSSDDEGGAASGEESARRRSTRARSKKKPAVESTPAAAAVPRTVNKRPVPRAKSSLPNAKALALAKGTGAKVQ